MIKVRSRSRDALGGSGDTLTTVTADVSCWRQAAGDRETLEFQKRGIRVTHKIYFAADPGVDERNVLVMGDDTMSVRSGARPDASAGMGVLWRIMVELE